MSEFDAAISDLSSTIRTLEQQLELTKQEWIKAIKRAVPDWFRREAREAVTQNPHVAVELGAEKIAALKAEIEELASGASELVDRMVADEQWPHLVKDQHGNVPNAATIWPANNNALQPDLGLRKLLWKIYPIFRKYGVGNKTTIDAGWERSEYPYRLPELGGTEAISARYIDLCGKRYQITQRLLQIQTDQKRAQAGKMWDEA